MSHPNAPARLNTMQQSPDLVKKLVDLSMAIANSGHIDPALSDLVDIRASQMNGCAFCLDMHVKEARLHGERELRIECAVKTTHRTGVEMEALTGATVAALTVYDMCKALSHAIVLGPAKLLGKRGGRHDFGSAG